MAHSCLYLSLFRPVGSRLYILMYASTSLYGYRRNKRTGRGHLTHAYLISLHAKVSNSVVTPCMRMWIACEYIYSWEYLWEPLGPVSTCLWTRDLITNHWCAKLDFLVWEYCHVRTLFSTGYFVCLLCTISCPPGIRRTYHAAVHTRHHLVPP